MPPDLYSDGEDTAVTTEKPAKEEGAATGLLPKSFFGDKPLEKGKRCEVEIRAVYDDQVEVSKVAESDYKGEDDDETQAMSDGSSMAEDMMD